MTIQLQGLEMTRVALLSKKWYLHSFRWSYVVDDAKFTNIQKSKEPWFQLFLRVVQTSTTSYISYIIL